MDLESAEEVADEVMKLVKLDEKADLPAGSSTYLKKRDLSLQGL